MRIAIGSDHRGFALKQIIMQWLSRNELSYEDYGCYNSESVDYPDIAREVTGAVSNGDCRFGILICGTGIGMSITANKVTGIRAALCHNAFGARRARQHNDANVLCLSAEESQADISAVIKVFLETGFEGGHHQRRLDKIKAMESLNTFDSK